MFFSVLQIFCPRLSLKRTRFVLTRVTCSREMGVCFWLNTPMKERSFWLWTNLHELSHDASVFREWEILLHSHWKNSYTKWLKIFFFIFFKKWDLRWPSRLKFQLLHQMRSHLLKRQKLLVLTLMGFQLVPLDEILSTALMVTLKENETKSKPVHHNTPQTTYQYNEIKGKRRDLRIIVLDIASPASGEPEPCGSSGWYLWQRPRGIHQPDTWRREQVNGWNAAWETPKINVTIPRRRKKRNMMAYLCGFSPLWLSSCLVSW